MYQHTQGQSLAYARTIGADRAALSRRSDSVLTGWQSTEHSRAVHWDWGDSVGPYEWLYIIMHVYIREPQLPIYMYNYVCC